MRKLLAVSLASFLAACASKPVEAPKATPEKEVPVAPPLGDATIGTWGFDTNGVNSAVSPGDDFDIYANGAWKEKFTIPADLSSYGVFIQLRLDAEENVHAILKDLAAESHPVGSLEQKVGDAFGSWMNAEAIEAAGTEPLRAQLERIAAFKTRSDVAAEFASLHTSAPYGVGIIPDPADTTRYIAFVGQAGLGMPDRDYYLKEEERFVEYRSAYVEYITTLLSLAGVKDAAKRAKSIVELETEIAKVHWTKAESRDIKKIYNPMPPEQLAALAPDFAFPSVLETLSLSSVKTFLVAQPSAIEGAGKIFKKTKLKTLKDYLTFHYVRNHADYLPKAFDDAHFSFYSKTLRGIEEQRDRWKRGVNFINGGMGEAVGKIYLERHFPPEAKTLMDELVANLIAAFEERLESNEWMDEDTRKQALLKLSTFEPRIGFPSKWIDYTPLEITEGAFQNAQAVREFQWQDQVKRLSGAVDRALWPYPPQTVNASYNPLLNQITFPAGILQPPFFDPKADPAINYGAIGAVIGHEIGHGFDDQGRRFDEKGRIRDWWTQAADHAFSKRTDRLGSQYSSYTPIEGLNINGELTMGENIGDLGGLQMAYAAYHRYLASCCGGEAPVIDGLTGDQRFFLGWAQVWRSMSREDALRQRVLTDPHSPPRFRINGVVRNLDPWYEAFGVTEKNALYLPPEKRVRIW